jgi:uncharacterized membrane protein YesL
MSGNKDFEAGLLFTISNYTWWFLLGNFYFALTNIPFIFVSVGSSATGNFNLNIITFISMLPAGPALIALLSVMGKIVREKDTDMTKDFFKAYKKNFLEALLYWCLLITILTIVYIDIIYLNMKSQTTFIRIVLLAIAAVIVSMAFYVFPLISRFYFKVKDVLKVSFYYAFKKFHITILNWIYLVGLSYVTVKTSSVVLAFLFWSILCYLIMFNTKSILKEIEEKYVVPREE